MSCSTIIVGSSWSFGVPRLLINGVKGMQGLVDFNPLQLLCHLGSQKQFGVLSLKKHMPINLCLQHLQFICTSSCVNLSPAFAFHPCPFFFTNNNNNNLLMGYNIWINVVLSFQIPDACNPKLLAKFSTFHSTPPNLVVALVNLKWQFSPFAQYNFFF